MTLEEAKSIEGTCTECKEHTTLVESCCGAPVECEGHIYDADDIEEEPKLCRMCDGSGMGTSGPIEKSRCDVCRGRGVIEKEVVA